MYDVVSIGEPVIDFNPVQGEGKLQYVAMPAGGAANVLSAAIKMGACTAMIGWLGADIFGDYIKDCMNRLGIDVRCMRQGSEKNTGIGFVQLSPEGERSFLFYRPRGMLPMYVPETDNEVLRQTRIFHYTSVSLCKGQIEGTLAAARYAKAQGALLSFDVNYRKAFWNSEEEAKETIYRCIRDADILKMSEDELQFLYPDDTKETCADKLLADGCALIAITMGARGCYCRTRNTESTCSGYQVEAVDTTGCGDSFAGTMLGQLSQMGKPIEELSAEEMRAILCKATAAANLCASRSGSMDVMATEEEIMRLVRTGEQVSWKRQLSGAQAEKEEDF